MGGACLPVRPIPPKPMTTTPSGDTFEVKVIDMLARLDTKMDTLLGSDGEQGRVPRLEEKVDALQKKAWTFGGILVGVGGLFHWIIDIFRAVKAH